MNYYVVTDKSPKALAVYDTLEYDAATEQARKDFGPSVIVIDQEMYDLECQLATRQKQRGTR